MSDNDEVSSTRMDFSGDTTSTAMDPYFDDVLCDRQQSVLNELREDLCYDDLKYLSKHKEVEAIATLLLKEVLKNAPKNPWTHAAHYLSDPRTSDIIAKFSESQNSITLDLVNQDADADKCATTTAMMADVQTSHQSGQSEGQENEQGYEQYQEPCEKQNVEQDEEQD